MLGASNLRQQKRLWAALGRPELAKANNEAAPGRPRREEAVLNEIMLTRTADEWEAYLQSQHVPAARVRRMEEALADPHLASRGVVHRFEEARRACRRPSACRSPPSPWRMAGRGWTARRRWSASIPTRCWANWAIGRRDRRAARQQGGLTMSDREEKRFLVGRRRPTPPLLLWVGTRRAAGPTKEK